MLPTEAEKGIEWLKKEKENERGKAHPFILNIYQIPYASRFKVNRKFKNRINLKNIPIFNNTILSNNVVKNNYEDIKNANIIIKPVNPSRTREVIEETIAKKKGEKIKIRKYGLIKIKRGYLTKGVEKNEKKKKFVSKISSTFYCVNPDFNSNN